MHLPREVMLSQHPAKSRELWEHEKSSGSPWSDYGIYPASVCNSGASGYLSLEPGLLFPTIKTLFTLAANRQTLWLQNRAKKKTSQHAEISAKDSPGPQMRGVFFPGGARSTSESPPILEIY